MSDDGELHRRLLREESGLGILFSDLLVVFEWRARTARAEMDLNG